MFHSLRRRWSRILHASMLLVLAFGLVAQPVLGAMGEVHELAAQRPC